MKQLVHTPDGVRDIYGDEYKRKLAIEDKIREVIGLYGYEDIQTPTFECFDVFSKEIGTTPSKELYKFFDKDGDGVKEPYYYIFYSCNKHISIFHPGHCWKGYSVMRAVHLKMF